MLLSSPVVAGLLDSQMTGWGRTGAFVHTVCPVRARHTHTHTYTKAVCPAAIVSTGVSWMQVCVFVYVAQASQRQEWPDNDPCPWKLPSPPPPLPCPPSLFFTHALMCTSTSFILVSALLLHPPPPVLSFLSFKFWSSYTSFFFDLSCSSVCLPLILFYTIYLVSLVWNEVACMSTVDLLLCSEGKMSHRRSWREPRRKRDVENICHIRSLLFFLSSCCQPLICPH